MSRVYMKEVNKNKIISIVLLVAAVVIVITVMIKTNTKQTKNSMKALQESVDLQIQGFVYTEVGADQDQWEVKAETATYDKKLNEAVLDVVQIKLTTADGRIFTMKADRGTITTDKKNIQIQGNVEMASDNGYKFYTESLNYRDSEKKIFTNASITMENKGMKVTGKGLTLYINKGQLNIPSAVKATLNPSGQ